MDKNVSKLELVSFKKNELFDKVIAHGLMQAKESLIIGTYNLQDIRISSNESHQRNSLSDVILSLLKRNVQVLIVLAAFMQKSRFIQTLSEKCHHHENIRIRFCRRMHLKAVIVDLKYAYFGSANLSGAGVGLKSLQKRNFELGFITHDSDLIADIASTFMEIFNGKFCSKDRCHFFENSHLQDPCKGILHYQF